MFTEIATVGGFAESPCYLLAVPIGNGTGPAMNSEMMDREEVLRAEHKVLTSKHRGLDLEIREIEEDRPHDQLTLRRLKKQKLALKDRIARIEDQITPDIIA